MYRQGHGDCFLLAFPGSTGDAVYVLIDCGYKPGSNGEKFALKEYVQIVENIKVATGGRIDLVVITHEHQDHVNGFWKEGEPYFANFEIGAAWFAWTEDPDDDLAKELRRRHGDQLLGLVAARDSLAAAGDNAASARLDALLSLELGVDDPAKLAAAAKKKKKDANASVNKQGMKLVKDKAGASNTRYIRPHERIMSVPGVKGVRVFALGPPRVANLLADEDPQGSEGFPGHAVRARASFFAAAEYMQDGSARDRIQPFAPRFAVPFEHVFDHPEHGGFFKEHYGTAPDPPNSDVSEESAPNAAWRRIDNDWLYSAEQLALVLNEGINNTSLVLAFELEKSGKVLLFIGDAQRGNWISWTKGVWKDGDKTITARDLLSRTVLYKVGHHASHNATLNGNVDSEYPNLAWMGLGPYGSEFTAMITAVRDWAYAQTPYPWRHPLPSIKAALVKKCRGRVFQTDTREIEPASDVPDAEWQDFMQRTYADPDDLYFEHEIRDRPYAGMAAAPDEWDQ
jgi:hypothetical protein